MKILAIESSTRAPSLAVCEWDSSVSAETGSGGKSGCYHLQQTRLKTLSRLDSLSFNSASEGRKNVSSALVPNIQAVLKQAGLTIGEIELIAVAIGPGSFTGLRLGVVAAKTIAYATGCKTVAVNHFDSIRCQALQQIAGDQHALDQAEWLGVAFDIGRGEVLVRCMPIADIPIHDDKPPVIAQPNAWASSLSAGYWIGGSGIKLISEASRAHLRLIDEVRNLPTAETVALLGGCYFEERGSDDFWKLEPFYSRLSAAEERSPIKLA